MDWCPWRKLQPEPKRARYPHPCGRAGKQNKGGELLSINRKTLWKKMNTYDLKA